MLIGQHLLAVLLLLYPVQFTSSVSLVIAGMRGAAGWHQPIAAKPKKRFSAVETENRSKVVEQSDLDNRCRGGR